jgi:hypothetical protein
MSFEKNVFVNCPFDDDYIFTIRAKSTVFGLGYESLTSTTKSNLDVKLL